MTRRHRPPAAAYGLAASVLFLAAAVIPSHAATNEEVDAAIEKGKKFLYSQMKAPGRWEIDAKRDPKAGHHEWEKMQGGSFGGYTSCAVYALLACGESPQKPELKAAIEFLKTADVVGVYALGMRCQVWSLLPQTREIKGLLDRDAKLLVKGLNIKGPGRGLWDYDDPSNHGARIDHSVAQYGVLGLWAAVQGGYDLNDEHWQLMDSTWRKHQFPDGGWTYDGNGRTFGGHQAAPTPAMTAAGVATLFITQDFLQSNSGLNCTGNVTNDNIEAGLKWMDEHFHEVNNTYTWYGIERIGAASGRKYFGKTDWYARGAEQLVRTQHPDGRWATSFPGATPVPDTTFALLFLARGRAPVMMNKLDWGREMVLDGKDGKKVSKWEGDWNQRPRDVANLAKHVGKNIERYLSWQVVNLHAQSNDLHDSPILYIAGKDTPRIGNEGVNTLRRYVEEGGIILGNADCGDQGFSVAFRRLAKKMFPKYEFRELPPNHPIYVDQVHQASKWKNKPSVLGLSNGVRELMILVPDADPAKAWQSRSDRLKEELFQLGANIFFYAVDKQDLRQKGVTHIVADKGVAPAQTIKVARVVAGENPDPEPAGWRQLNNYLRNQHKTAVEVVPTELGKGKLGMGKDLKVAHLTGTTKVELTAEQRSELKQFVEGGGTLIVEAAGGSGVFAESMEKELAEIFGNAAFDQLTRPLPPDHALYTIPNAEIKNVRYRRYANLKLGRLKAARIKGIEHDGRVAVFFSPDDLSTGLVGQAVDGIFGYQPPVARDLMRNLLFYGAAEGKPGPAPTTKEPPAAVAGTEATQSPAAPATTEQNPQPQPQPAATAEAGLEEEEAGLDSPAPQPQPAANQDPKAKPPQPEPQPEQKPPPPADDEAGLD